ncbi:hypothetical protein BIWAKO_05005 [Bosea sp. BIWAKO-01]|nr:hypothetical protein BIWAKO_05005 [Bosea sp. BIWAKO-01]
MVATPLPVLVRALFILISVRDDATAALARRHRPGARLNEHCKG